MRLELTKAEAELLKSVLGTLYHEPKANEFRGELLDGAVENRVPVVGRILRKLQVSDG